MIQINETKLKKAIIFFPRLVIWTRFQRGERLGSEDKDTRGRSRSLAEQDIQQAAAAHGNCLAELETGAAQLPPRSRHDSLAISTL
jgi:hypothetical protein